MRLSELDEVQHRERPARFTCRFEGFLEERDEAATLYLILSDGSGQVEVLVDRETIGYEYIARESIADWIDVELEFLPRLARNIPHLRRIAPAAGYERPRVVWIWPYAPAPIRNQSGHRRG